MAAYFSRQLETPGVVAKGNAGTRLQGGGQALFGADGPPISTTLS